MIYIRIQGSFRVGGFMKRTFIYDLPTRIFHWSFAAAFMGAFLISKVFDDDDPVFSFHMLLGLFIGGLVLFRIIWGMVGTRYARFTSFALNPKDLAKYVRGILTGSKEKWVGHNPASSWAAMMMLGCAIVLATTGVLMASGYKKAFEDAHEIAANVFLITALLHVTGVLLHSLRHRDGIVFSMLSGTKEGVSELSTKVSSRPIMAFVMVAYLSLLGSYLVKNYDATTQQLNFFGKNLSLGENEHRKHKSHHED